MKTLTRVNAPLIPGLRAEGRNGVITIKSKDPHYFSDPLVYNPRLVSCVNYCRVIMW